MPDASASPADGLPADPTTVVTSTSESAGTLATLVPTTGGEAAEAGDLASSDTITATVEASMPVAAPIPAADGEVITPEPTGLAPVLDPYYMRGGETFYHRTDCAGFSNCTASSTPIQAALDEVKQNGSPDDGTIYIEGGSYAENVSITDFDVDLTLQGGADGKPSTLSGLTTVTNTPRRITFRNFIFDGGFSALGATVTIADSTLNAGVVLGAADDSTISNSTLNAGLIVNGGDNITVSDSTLNGGVVVSGATGVTINDSALGAGSGGGVIVMGGGEASLVAESSSVTVQNSTLSGSVDVNQSSVTIGGTAGNDTVQVRLVGEGKGTIAVAGGAGDDTLAVDFGNAGPAAQGAITFDGGAGYDVMEFRGGTFNNAVYTPTGPDS
ncbi:MAG: hypothetical protein AAB295_04175, partial [Chloroflexota bacterium]